MKNSEKNIDDFFREELGGYTETPPPALWDALEKKLVATPAPASRLPYHWLAYLAVLLITVGTSFYLYSRHTSGGYIGQGAALVADNNAVNATQYTNSTNNSDSKSSPIAKGSETNSPVASSKTNPATETNNAGDNKEIVAANLSNTPLGSNVKNAAPKKGSVLENSYKKLERLSKQTPANKLHKGNKGGQQQKGTLLKGGNNNTVNGVAENLVAGVSAANNSKQGGPNNNGAELAADNNPVANKQILQDAKTGTKKDIENKKELANKPKAETTPIAKPVVKKEQPKYAKFEAGIKTGYERGFDNTSAQKIVGSVYLQYNISPKLSIMVQPGVKESYLNSLRVGKQANYYQVPEGAKTMDGVRTGADSTTMLVIPNIGDLGLLWVRNYYYAQRHDSIVKSYKIGGRYTEYEMPLLMKYKLNKNLSVYAGVNMVMGKTLSIQETTTNYSIDIMKVVHTYGGYYSPAPPPPPIGEVFSYQGTPYSSYLASGPLYSSKSTTQFRFGYMLGFSYEFADRWMVDGLLQQTPSTGNSTIGGVNINQALGNAYMRMTLGYKLSK